MPFSSMCSGRVSLLSVGSMLIDLEVSQAFRESLSRLFFNSNNKRGSGDLRMGELTERHGGSRVYLCSGTRVALITCRSPHK